MSVERCTRFHRKHKPERGKVIAAVDGGRGAWVEFPTFADEMYDCDVIACRRCHRIWPLKGKASDVR